MQFVTPNRCFSLFSILIFYPGYDVNFARTSEQRNTLLNLRLVQQQGDTIMKNNTTLAIAAAALLGFSACGNKEEAAAETQEAVTTGAETVNEAAETTTQAVDGAAEATGTSASCSAGSCGSTAPAPQ